MNQMQHFSRSLTFISTFLQPLRRKLFHQVSRNKSRRKNILATVLMLIFDPIQCTLKITKYQSYREFTRCLPYEHRFKFYTEAECK